MQVQDREQFKGVRARAAIDMLLSVLYGLLALAVVIAIMGIVNTLALSVVERRGRSACSAQSECSGPRCAARSTSNRLLIAVFGALVGVLLGVVFGWGFVRTLADQGLDQISVPWGQLLAMLIGSGVVGVLAALWPASRAARGRSRWRRSPTCRRSCSGRNSRRYLRGLGGEGTVFA